MISTRRLFFLQLAGVSLSPLALTKYVDALPIPDRAKPASKGRYRVVLRELQAKIHRDLQATTFWGYDGMSPGPIFGVRSGEPITVEWVNSLPAKHLLPVDHALHGAGSEIPEVRAIVHLHGARVPPDSDGNPEMWTSPGQSKTSFYPNRQDAAGLSYHDHAMGITRLNARSRLERHGARRRAAGDAHHREVRRVQGPLRLALPCAGARGQRDDAALRSSLEVTAAPLRSRRSGRAATGGPGAAYP